MNEYSTVFSVSEAPLPWWPDILALIFPVLGFVLLQFPKRFAKINPLFGTLRGWAWSFLIGGFAMCALLFYGVHEDRGYARGVLASGDYQVVEGVVEDLGSRPNAGRSFEGFKVAGKEFVYSEYVYTGAFNQASIGRDGPVRNGMRVRITCFRHGDYLAILKLEVKQ